MASPLLSTAKGGRRFHSLDGKGPFRTLPGKGLSRSLTVNGLFHSICLASLILARVCAHAGHESESPPCPATDNPVRISAPYAPGTITVDGQASDWDTIDGQDVALMQAFSKDSGQPPAYPQGSGMITVKVAHDGQSVFFLLKIPGNYIYNPRKAHLSVSSSLMFGIGDDATLYNMGGCPQEPGSCTPEACRNHEVDLVHFEVSAAIPGRQYGRNLMDLLEGTGADRIGNLSDGFGYSPHCKYSDHNPEVLQGSSQSASAENDWLGSWGHTAVSTTYGLVSTDSPYATAGEAGDFVFEFSRPLRTLDQLQQDVQFTIGKEHRLGVAVWYPVDGQPWLDHQHYILSCDWAVLSLAPSPVPLYGWSYSTSSQSISTTAATAVSAMAMVFSLTAVFVSIVVGWWVRANHRHFDNVEGL